MPKKREKKSGENINEIEETPTTDGSSTFTSVEKEKQIYLTQIRYLNEELERKQLKCDSLEKKNKTLLSQFSALEMEKKGITEYLKNCLFEKEEEVEKLLDRLEIDHQASEQDRAVLQLHYDGVNKELQDHVRDLAEKNETLEKRLAALAEFQQQREELIFNMESLEKELGIQQKKHKNEIQHLEMKALLEKRILKQEMEQHTASLEGEVEQLVEQKLPEASKKVVRENMEVKACFSQLSNRAQILMQENANLHQYKNELISEVDVLEQMLRETSRMNCLQKKMIQQLTEKCKEQQEEQKEYQEQMQQLHNQKMEIQTELESFRKDRAAMMGHCAKISEKFSTLKADLEEERRSRSGLSCGIQEAGHILREALMEEPTQQDLDLDFVWWKQQMHKALMVLDKHLRASAVENNRQNKAGGAGSGLYPELNLGFQVNYVPRHSKKTKNGPSRTGTAPFTTVPLFRRPLGPKTTGSVGVARSTLGFYGTKNTANKFK